MLDLNEIRNNIDKIDSQLVELFEERMKLTTEVAEYKIETGKKVLDLAREKAKLESVKKLVRNPDNVHKGVVITYEKSHHNKCNNHNRIISRSINIFIYPKQPHRIQQR